MKFTEFQSLVNENPKNITGIFAEDKFKNLWCVATEKLHGANFSVYLFKDKGTIQIRFASRNQFIGIENQFFNFKRYFTEEKIKNLKDIAENLITEEGLCIRFIGELFGGHDALNTKPVQKEILYDGDIQFKVFSVESYNLSDQEDIHYMDWLHVIHFCDDFDLKTVPIINIDTLENLYKIDPTEQSALSSKENQIREGICIRELYNEVGNPPLILKKRSPNFLENKGKLSSSKELSLDPKFLETFNKVLEMVTPQRVSNVNSHFGFTSIKEFASLQKSVMDDITKDSIKDYDIDLNFNDYKELKKVIGKRVSPLIKQELLK